MNMENEKNVPGLPEQNSEEKENAKVKRRTLLKALAGIPVLGVFGAAALRKNTLEGQKKKAVNAALGLDELQTPAVLKSSSPGDLLRIGIIGFGNRANAHAHGLGYMLPEDVEARKKNGTLDDWMAQENLNVAITGICDVFDLHAERGLATARSDYGPGAHAGNKLPVKRYKHYQEMLADKEIDAVMIATPDFHHARMAIDAARAGKHIYLEKSVAMTEEQLNTLYKAVKESGVTFQLGHQITHSVVFQQAREIIKKDILGKITLIETTTNRNTASGAWIRHLDANGKPKPGSPETIDWDQWLDGTPKVPFSIDRYYNWTKWFTYDMGMIGQLFTHEYDAVNQLLGIGIPRSAVASGGIYYWKDNREIPDVLNCVWEYPDKDLTLMYSATLASSRSRGRVFMGHDASMELGSSLKVTIDRNSDRFRNEIRDGILNTGQPMILSSGTSGKVDAITSATEQYYASRGLINTNINGRNVDLTYLHIKEWIDTIRNGGETRANIDRAFEEGITCIMANKAYLEKRRVEWDPVNKKIV
jgi:predicted dehydrogenase